MENIDAGDPEEDLTLSEEDRLARQRANHEARRKRAKTAIKKGLVIVNTGKGKGKSGGVTKVINAIGSVGAVKFRVEAAKYRDEAARLREELAEIENQIRFSANVPTP